MKAGKTKIEEILNKLYQQGRKNPPLAELSENGFKKRVSQISHATTQIFKEFKEKKND